MLNTKNKYVKIIVRGFLFSLILFYLTNQYIPKLIIQPNHHIFHLIKILKSNNKIINHPTNVTFTNPEGMKIRGVFSYSEPGKINKGTLILIHGIRGDLSYFKTLVPQLNKEGYNTFAINLRGHGNSDGTYCTFGAKEKYDIQLAIDTLKNQFKISNEIGVWGQSLGGSVALQAMAVDERIKFGIIESTFSSYETITHAYFQRLFRLDLSGTVRYLTKRAARIAEFELKDANTTLACSKITQPVYMAHGDQDIHIPIENGVMNYDALQSNHKIFETVEGATHVNLWAIGGQPYLTNVFNFMESIK